MNWQIEKVISKGLCLDDFFNKINHLFDSKPINNTMAEAF